MTTEQDTTNGQSDGQYVGLTRTTQEEIMDTTNGPRNLQLENLLDVIDSLRHLMYATGAFRAIQDKEPVLFVAGDTLFEEQMKSTDVVDLEARAFGSFLLLQAVIRTPKAMDLMLEVLKARVVGHLRPDLLRVFDDAHAPPA